MGELGLGRTLFEPDAELKTWTNQFYCAIRRSHMSIANIDAIRKALENNHWVIQEERLVDEYRTTAYWKITRPDGTNQFSIAFSGGYTYDGLTKRTFEESTGCKLVGHPDVGCYFTRINRSWPSELSKFIEGLNRLG